MLGKSVGVDLQILERGFDGDVAVDFGAAPEFLVGSDAVEFFDQGVTVHVFQRFDFDQAGAAQAHAAAVQLGGHTLVQHDIVEHRALTEVGAVTDFELFDFAGV